MAWRSIMAGIVEAALDTVREACLGEGSDAEACAEALLAAADAVYSPLKPIDSGLGEARRVAAMLSSIIANAYIALAAGSGDEELKAVEEKLASMREADVAERVRQILQRAGAAVEPASAREAREALVKDIEEYLHPAQPAIPRRRRRPPRRPDPLQRLRRLVRELGRRDPLLAKAVARALRERGVSF